MTGLLYQVEETERLDDSSIHAEQCPIHSGDRICVVFGVG